MKIISYSCCPIPYTKLEQISPFVEFIRFVSGKNRLKILYLLSQGKHCVCEMVNHTKLPQTLISHHLIDLKKKNLVSREKKGLKVYYSITNKGKKILEILFSTQMKNQINI